MIKYKYNRTENVYTVEIENCTFLQKTDLPLTIQFREFVTNQHSWQTDLMPGMWAVWQPGFYPCNFEVRTYKGKVIFEHEFNVEIEGNFIEKTLYLFIKNLDHRPNGLVIGSHDGRFGHWVYPVFKNMSDVTIVDGSKSQFDKVVNNYSHLSKVTFVNEIVTPDGAEVEWFQGGSGDTDSVKKSVLAFSPEIISSFRKSISIDDLIRKVGYIDWLQLDAEGLDFELITSMEARPYLVIFETTHMSEEQIDKIIAWTTENGYKMHTDYREGIDRRLGNNAILIKNL